MQLIILLIIINNKLIVEKFVGHRKRSEKRAIDTQSEFLKQGIKETFKAQALLL